MFTGKKQQFISINVDDHIAEVDKAFDFVHYVSFHSTGYFGPLKNI